MKQISLCALLTTGILYWKSCRLKREACCCGFWKFVSQHWGEAFMLWIRVLLFLGIKTSFSPQSFTCRLTAVENMTPDNIRLQTDVLKSPFDRPERSWFSTYSACLNAEAVSSLCLINCSFCSWLHYLHNAENIWDSVNALSLFLITLDAPNSLFSSPVGQHFVWCGCKVGLVHSFDTQYSGKNGKCAQTVWHYMSD